MTDAFSPTQNSDGSWAIRQVNTNNVALRFSLAAAKGPYLRVHNASVASCIFACSNHPTANPANGIFIGPNQTIYIKRPLLSDYATAVLDTAVSGVLNICGGEEA